ncbi:unnamed protein product [Rangifer tarandus platyrhynchus]|uniref:Uncharacterized protein n=2 Tax=Rangifer tarandus platyrhynchus TaxID=3082113 RepID=A0ABN8ZLW3_RANTA|nr:unnamed protein product [Rangifer tarandus platyrhynchus]
MLFRNTYITITAVKQNKIQKGSSQEKPGRQLCSEMGTRALPKGLVIACFLSWVGRHMSGRFFNFCKQNPFILYRHTSETNALEFLTDFKKNPKKFDTVCKFGSRPVLSRFSRVLTLCDPMDCSPLGSGPWGSPGKNTGLGCHALLQGICLTQNRACVSCISSTLQAESLTPDQCNKANIKIK